MQPDPVYLRRHYASLSDEALLEIDRAELVEMAQTLYDQEIRQRDLTTQAPHSELDHSEPTGSHEEFTDLLPGREEQSEEPADWLEESAEVFSSTFHPGTAPAPEISLCRDVLEEAGIPCYLDIVQEDENSTRCRLLVPGKFNQRAASLLDKKIFNDQFEAEWRAHLEALSDEELDTMNPRDAFCGLFDRIERVTRAYNEELTHRGRKT